MRVYAAELTCSTGVLGFQTFNNELRSNAEILSLRAVAIDVTFRWIQPSEVKSVSFERK